MKKKLQKISIAVAAVVLFIGVMLLSVKKNDHGQWKVATVSSFAQGGGESGDFSWFSENLVIVVKKGDVVYDATLGLTYKGFTIEVANYENIRTGDPIAIYNYCSSTLLPYRCFKDEIGLFSI
ncbi:hypothetical protein [Albibacterium sp.]|uniref:hypothetical protein n=1 Tax=Albibacterium sp. TaxID=2952885 RepID=UPI002BCFC7E2|nr:hypothetical protein [Albibacterium sp.]HUH18108.1 hypothetical protein [Albibacterium sp.]